ncbi:BEN domain-containing protein 5 [Labeo rohita]|uniref:BEN domain-containing protein 5 n=1 Tax=Labeo rohita TaxID=84645 RepID=A0ABQ8L529_LABRO|nr:BEN domain-containing protein 5 [Labeo rohita]
MFAYVYYLDDGVKDSVNVRDIKHFDPKNTTDFSSTQTYWILRKGRFTTGQILFMKGNNTSPGSIKALPVTTGKNTSPGSIQARPVTTESSPALNPQTAAENSSEHISENLEVDIGEGVFVHSGKWKKIQDNIKDSLFVKEMAVCVWGTSTLANRSLEGKSCPTTKSDPRPL